MKKILSALAVLGVLVVGCGNDGPTDEMVKNYEANLNKNLSKIKQELEKSLYASDSLVFPDFKCRKENLKIVCNSSGIVAKSNNQEIFSIDEIAIKTSQFYTGDKKGEISISDAYANIAKNGFSDELSLNGLKFSAITQGLVMLASASSSNLSFLPHLIDGKYDVVLTDKYSLKDEFLSGDIRLVINNTSKKIKLDLVLEHMFNYKVLATLADEYKLATFDVNSQSLKVSDDLSSLSNASYDEQEQIKDIFAKSIILKKLGFSNSIDDIKPFESGLGYVKAKLNKYISNGRDVELSKLVLQAIEKFEKSNPHLFNVILSKTQGVSIFDINMANEWNASSEDKAKLHEGMSLKINDIDFTNFIIK